MGATHEPGDVEDVVAGAVDAVLLLVVLDDEGVVAEAVEGGVVVEPAGEAVVTGTADVELEASKAPVEAVAAVPPPPPPQPARPRAATTGSRPVRNAFCRYFMIGRSDEADGGNKHCLPVGQSGRYIHSTRSHDANTAPATPLS